MWIILKKVLGIIPILVYILILITFNIWQMTYYQTPEALDFSFLTYIPYMLSGAFIMCLTIGLIVRKINGNHHILFLIMCFVFLMNGIYFNIWLHEAFMRSFPNLSKFYLQEVPIYYGFYKTDTPMEMLESDVGFILGWSIQNYRINKRYRLEMNSE